MRFIINFILYGILFYIIYLYFPDAFKTLVGWVDQVFAFLRDLFLGLWAKFQATNPSHPESEPAHSLLLFSLFRKWWI